MDEVIEAITKKLNSELKYLRSELFDESGYRGDPDKYDNTLKNYKERIEALRLLRKQAEDIALL